MNLNENLKIIIHIDMSHWDRDAEKSIHWLNIQHYWMDFGQHGWVLRGGGKV